MDQSNIKAFDVHSTSASSEWIRWKRAVDLYILSKGYTDDKQKQATLLSLGGMDLQDIYYAIPGNETKSDEETWYQQTIRLLDAYFIPKSNVTYERYVFSKIIQRPDELTEQFINRLRRQVTKCEYSDEDAQLCQQIVAGCCNGEIRKECLEKRVLSVGAIQEIAQKIETVSSQLSAFEPKSTPASIPGVNSINRIASSNSTRSNDSKISCYGCGSSKHRTKDDSCPAVGKECHFCHKIGHFDSVCHAKKNQKEDKPQNKSRRRDRKKPPRSSDEKSENSSASGKKSVNQVSTVNYVFHVSSKARAKELPCAVGGVQFAFTVDSGADENIISKSDWCSLKSRNVKVVSQVRNNENKKLFAFGASEPLAIVGKFSAEICVGNRSLVAEIVVVDQDNVPALLSRETATDLGVLEIRIPQSNVNAVTSTISPNRKVFQGIGLLKDVEIDIPIDESVPPHRQKPRPIPLNLRDQIDEELDSMLENDIIEPVDTPSPWVSNMVISHHNDKIRICVDMRDANKAIITEDYPFTTMEDIRAAVKSAKCFARLDLRRAFYQILLKIKSRVITTFITHRGLFRSKRLMFGIKCAPGIFQSILRKLLKLLGFAINSADDIFIFANSEEELFRYVNQVIDLLEQKGLTLNYDKCIFYATKIEYVGFTIVPGGIQVSDEKRAKILEWSAPTSKAEVESFLGFVNFVRRFIPNYSAIAAPLYDITRKNVHFKWEQEHESAFQALKAQLTTDRILKNFNPRYTTQLYCDAGPNALGAVLVQIGAEGPEYVDFASKTLTDVERRYSQLEKEALALVWGVERFHYYLYGRHFQLITDNKPIQLILTSSDLNQSLRVQRWHLRLQGYDFELVHKAGKNNIADPLSRLVSSTDRSHDHVESYIHLVINASIPKLMTLKEIEQASLNDPEFVELRNAIESNNWSKMPAAYTAISSELSVYNDIILRGDRIVVPSQLHQRVLDLAHEGHPGIVSLKARLRTKVWWPNIYAEAEHKVKTCPACQAVAKFEPPEPIRRRLLPERPWDQVAFDFMGPLPSGDYLFVVVDLYSRFYEIKITKTSTAKFIVETLHEIFARYGYPSIITCDNAPQHHASEVESFCNEYGIRMFYSTPFWPQSNGAVERQNRNILKTLKIAQIEGKDWRNEIQKFLLMMRNTPNHATGVAPAELVFRFRPRDQIPSIQNYQADPEMEDRENLRKYKGQIYANDSRHATRFVPGQQVLVRNEQKTNKLTPSFDPEPATVVATRGTEVDISKGGRTYTRNSSHLKEFQSSVTPQPAAVEIPEIRSNDPPPEPSGYVSSPAAPSSSTEHSSPRVQDTTIGCPKREIRIPSKFNDYVLNK
ncbi:uncharacterized protein K02A2.6-like [Planococcus citri]|uniref:uncharacterized protein K02A2.6-like n=1 Tax=Planococcus citri TaxID=170843 RepID=UPI0031FA346A